MADFCDNCSRDMGFKEPDLDIKALAEFASAGFYVDCLCEGCGMRGVGKNEDGSIFVIEADGERREWDPEEDRMKSYSDKAIIDSIDWDAFGGSFEGGGSYNNPLPVKGFAGTYTPTKHIEL